MLIVLSVLALVIIGIAIGLVWRGTIIIGDRAALDRMTSRLNAEMRVDAATRDTLRQMRDAARRGDVG